MVTQDARSVAAGTGTSPEGTAAPGTPGTPGTGTQAAERKVQIVRVSPEGAATLWGAVLGALGLVWVLYERVLAFSGVLGFWVCWYVTFLLLYAAMAWMQWDRRDVVNKVTTVALAGAGVVVLAIVFGTDLYTLVRGLASVFHPNFWVQSMAFAGPQSGLGIGGAANAAVGTLEQIALATALSVPLAVACAVFLSEVGGSLARPVRIIVEAMTALPDIIAGLFIYALFILTLGMQKSGLAASLAIAVTMLPIIARASEVVLRLVPGTLREASYALGSSQWRTVWNVVLPTARPGLATAVVLGMARGIGETAPVLIVAGFTKEFNFNPLSGPMVSLPLYIWNYVHIEGSATAPLYIVRGFGAGVMLVLVVLGLFTLARKLGGTAPGELTKRQRRQLARQGEQV
jgi:phosphate transport system permease protein